MNVHHQQQQQQQNPTTGVAAVVVAVAAPTAAVTMPTAAASSAATATQLSMQQHQQQHHLLQQNQQQHQQHQQQFPQHHHHLPQNNTAAGTPLQHHTAILTSPAPPAISLLSGCRVCGSPSALRRCSSCKTAFYCSQTHQQVDWPNHRAECRQIARVLAERPPPQFPTNGYAVVENGGGAAATVAVAPGTGAMNNWAGDVGGSASFSDQTDSLAASGSNGGELTQFALAAEQMQQQLHQQQHQNQNQQQPMMQVTSNIATGPSAVPSQMPFDAGLDGQTSQQPELAQQHDLLAAESKKERDARNFSAENTMRFSEMSMESSISGASSMRDDDLCKIIISDMNTYGLAVIDDFLGRAAGMEILREVDNMYGAGVFQNGQLVSNTAGSQNKQTIRGDKITWVKGTEPTCTNIGMLINQIDNLVITANRMRDNGTLGQYKIRERTKAMVACYPGSGSHYVMHVDNPNQDGRVITAIYYLNVNWDSEKYGGLLTIHPKPGNSLATIEPLFDRILFFWSDRRNPHEVQPAHRTRYAITVWYFDADEREMALNRNRQQQQQLLQQASNVAQSEQSSSSLAASSM